MIQLLQMYSVCILKFVLSGFTIELHSVLKYGILLLEKFVVKAIF